MNTTSIDSALLAAPYQLNIWFGSFLWIVGNLGCIGNTIVFRSQPLRGRAYSIYLFSEAMSDFLYFNFVLLTRILQKGFQISIMTRYDIICKIRQFFSLWSNQVSFTFFSFATIDRLLSAQRLNKYRQWSNRVALAYKLSIGCLLFWFLLISHRFILYSANNGQCAALAGFYANFDNYLEVIFSGICPPIVMSMLAYLLIRSVRDVVQRRIAPVNTITPATVAHRTVLQQMDSQLTLMLILQSIITIITYVPYAIELIYTNVTQNWSKSSVQNAQETVFVEFVHILSYVFFASGFYVSFISNGGFRRQIKIFFQAKKENDPTGVIQTIYHTGATVIIQPKAKHLASKN